jgi:hypothetical protein
MEQMEFFKTSTTYCEKTIIWIMFQILKIETLTQLIDFQLHKK